MLEGLDDKKGVYANIASFVNDAVYEDQEWLSWMRWCRVALVSGMRAGEAEEQECLNVEISCAERWRQCDTQEFRRELIATGLAVLLPSRPTAQHSGQPGVRINVVCGVCRQAPPSMPG